MAAWLSLLIAVLFPRLLSASILGSDSLIIDFTNAEEAAAKATWDPAKRIGITSQGLGWDGEAASVVTGWIQTKSLVIGQGWRPPSMASIRVTIEPAPQPILLNSGQTSTPYPGNVFVRYSSDTKRWSTWQSLRWTPASDEKITGRFFRGPLDIPSRERLEYIEWLEAYQKLDVPWRSDEVAMAEWIQSCDPTFFDRCQPVIGYIEFLFEVDFHGGQRITKFAADLSYGMSGMHLPAKNPGYQRQRSSLPWTFKRE